VLSKTVPCVCSLNVACSAVPARALILRLIIAVTVILTTVSAQNADAGWLPSLSAQELKKIHRTTEQRLTQSRRSSTGVYDTHPLDIQVLFVERVDQKKKGADEPSVVEVFVYDYTTAQARVDLLDLHDYSLLQSKVIEESHLPLNHAEQTFTVDLLQHHDELLRRLDHEFQQHFTVPLPELNQLDMKVSVWRPDSGNNGHHDCHTSRCALVSIFTNSYFNFSAEPIVDLVSGKVLLDAVK